LELSSEGSEPGRVASVKVSERVAAIIAPDGSIGLLAVEARGDGGAIDFVLKSVVGGVGGGHGVSLLLLSSDLAGRKLRS
jgi:hypothetical protein